MAPEQILHCNFRFEKYHNLLNSVVGYWKGLQGLIFRHFHEVVCRSCAKGTRVKNVPSPKYQTRDKGLSFTDEGPLLLTHLGTSTDILLIVLDALDGRNTPIQ